MVDKNIEILGEVDEQMAEILTPEALEFIQNLHRIYNPAREEALERRTHTQTAFNMGIFPKFLDGSEDIRESDWSVAPIPDDMAEGYVEITGPVDRKMIINALNSGAEYFMADFEDSCSPTWKNMVHGQVNLRDAFDGTIELKTEKKKYVLKEETAKLMARFRGWHLLEKNLLINGNPISASIFDLGLLIFHNAKKLVDREETLAVYAPKIESYLEARLLDKVLSFAESNLGLPKGSVKVVVLIETLPAAFQMNEILWELRDRVCGLNAGRWDYIFSSIKVMGKYHVFPNRSEITMDKNMMDSYASLLVKTCGRRGVVPIGGMSALIPRKDDLFQNAIAVAKVRKDKQREAFLGFKRTWVSHPYLVDIAKEQMKSFSGRIGTSDVKITEEDLLDVPEGNCTFNELLNNVKVSLEYMYNWMNGNGCVAINYLMEDMATVEIARAQCWNWLYHKVELDDGAGVVDNALIDIALDQVVRDSPKYEQVSEIFSKLVKSKDCIDFGLLEMYEIL